MRAALPADHFEIAGALLSPVHEYLARLLHAALDANGVGADERALRDLLLPAIFRADAVETFPRVKNAYKKGIIKFYTVYSELKDIESLIVFKYFNIWLKLT